jgi:uroporphyrinogen-III synthase
MKDKTVAILETRLGKQLAELVEKRGGKPLHAPALAEVPAIDPKAIAALVRGLESQPARLAIFQTGVGTTALFAATDSLALTDQLLGLLAGMTVAVRGPKPTAALRSRAVRIDLSAKEPFTTVELLAALATVDVEKQRVLVQRYGVANIDLEEALRSRGADVIEITTYRWALPADTRPLIHLMELLDRGEIDAVAITNAAQIYNLFALAERMGRTMALQKGLNRTVVASIGPVATEALRKYGVSVAVEASPPKLGPFMSALEKKLGREG